MYSVGIDWMWVITFVCKPSFSLPFLSLRLIGEPVLTVGGFLIPNHFHEERVTRPLTIMKWLNVSKQQTEADLTWQDLDRINGKHHILSRWVHLYLPSGFYSPISTVILLRLHRPTKAATPLHSNYPRDQIIWPAHVYRFILDTVRKPWWKACQNALGRKEK